MDKKKKEKAQTQVIQWTKKTKDKHRPYNGKKGQSTNTGHTMDKKDKGQTQACVFPLSVLFIVWPVFVLCLFCPL
jgi:hypothetical protein